MLVLSFNPGDRGYMVCGETVVRFSVTAIGKGRVRLGWDAPPSIAIFRDEALSDEDRAWCESQLSRQGQAPRVDAKPQGG